MGVILPESAETANETFALMIVFVNMGVFSFWGKRRFGDLTDYVRLQK